MKCRIERKSAGTARPVSTESSRVRIPRKFLVYLTVTLLSCGGDGGTEPSTTTVTSVVVSPATVEFVALGRTSQLSASAQDASGNVVTGRTFSWSSGSPAVATVDESTGLVTAVGDGEAMITAQTDGVSGMATVSVDTSVQSIAALEVRPTSWRLRPGRSIELVARDLERGVELPPSWLQWTVDGIAGGSATVGSVSQSGVYTAPSEPGQFVVRATPEEGTAEAFAVSIIVDDQLGVPDLVRQQQYPRVYPVTSADSLEFVLGFSPGDMDLVQVEGQGGSIVSAQPWTAGQLRVAFAPEQVLAGRAIANDPHSLLGRLYIEGHPSLVYASLFANIRTAVMPMVSATRLSEDVQATDYLVNILVTDSIVSSIQTRPSARRFYDFFPDDFDFLFIVWPGDKADNRGYFGVRNDTEGLGIGAFDHGQWGSAGKLQGSIHYPVDFYFDLASRTTSHEIGHRWMVFLENDVLQAGAHWPLGQLGRGIMGISIPGSGAGSEQPFDLTPSGEDQYEVYCGELQPARDLGYNAMELYLAGWLPADSVPPYAVLDDQSTTLGDCGQVVSASVVTVEDVIAENGQRVPTHEDSQRGFRGATIVLSRGALLDEDALAFFDFMARRGEDETRKPITEGYLQRSSLPFYVATGGRATLVTRVR